jgi:hypothetical protein
MPTGFRHCDPRLPFLWQTAEQPAARWHAAGEGPANYFADTPSGAWAEFLRHEGIADPADLVGVQRSLWAVELPDVPAEQVAQPVLPDTLLFGDESSYPACQAAARSARSSGQRWLRAPSAALLPGQARGWTATPALERETTERSAWVRVHYGPCPVVGWPVVEAGQPPVHVVAMVRAL